MYAAALALLTIAFAADQPAVAPVVQTVTVMDEVKPFVYTQTVGQLHAGRLLKPDQVFCYGSEPYSKDQVLKNIPDFPATGAVFTLSTSPDHSCGTPLKSGIFKLNLPYQAASKNTRDEHIGRLYYSVVTFKEGSSGKTMTASWQSGQSMDRHFFICDQTGKDVAVPPANTEVDQNIKQGSTLPVLVTVHRLNPITKRFESRPSFACSEKLENRGHYDRVFEQDYGKTNLPLSEQFWLRGKDGRSAVFYPNTWYIYPVFNEQEFYFELVPLNIPSDSQVNKAVVELYKLQKGYGSQLIPQCADENGRFLAPIVVTANFEEKHWQAHTCTTDSIMDLLFRCRNQFRQSIVKVTDRNSKEVPWNTLLSESTYNFIPGQSDRFIATILDNRERYKEVATYEKAPASQSVILHTLGRVPEQVCGYRGEDLTNEVKIPLGSTMLNLRDKVATSVVFEGISVETQVICDHHGTIKSKFGIQQTHALHKVRGVYYVAAPGQAVVDTRDKVAIITLTNTAGEFRRAHGIPIVCLNDSLETSDEAVLSEVMRTSGGGPEKRLHYNRFITVSYEIKGVKPAISGQVYVCPANWDTMISAKVQAQARRSDIEIEEISTRTQYEATVKFKVKASAGSQNTTAQSSSVGARDIVKQAGLSQPQPLNQNLPQQSQAQPQIQLQDPQTQSLSRQSQPQPLSRTLNRQPQQLQPQLQTQPQSQTQEQSQPQLQTQVSTSKSTLSAQTILAVSVVLIILLFISDFYEKSQAALEL